jgi:phosphoglycerate dehydrogenase-like enzyme
MPTIQPRPRPIANESPKPDTDNLLKMAPHSTSPTTTPPHAPSEPKQTLYILSEFHPSSIKHAQSLFNCILPDNPQAAHWRKHATAILIKDYYITEKDLLAAPQLRVIGKQGVGLDKVDVGACFRHGVEIRNTPGVNASAVAEMTLALALSVAREIPQITRRQIDDGEVIRKETVRGTLLSGKTLGVIGMGHIGEAVARMFHGAFGAPVVAFDPYFVAGKGKWEGIPYTRAEGLEELLRAADVVTVHVPLTDATRDLISRKELEMMKSTAIILNTARGGIINEDDLVSALEDGLILGAGVDCHVEEPPTLARYARFWKHPRAVATPHIAAATEETQIATTNAAIDGVYEYLKSHPEL